MQANHRNYTQKKLRDGWETGTTAAAHGEY
jgi:cobalamin biosynthesis protein CbiD